MQVGGWQPRQASKQATLRKAPIALVRLMVWRQMDNSHKRRLVIRHSATKNSSWESAIKEAGVNWTQHHTWHMARQRLADEFIL